MNGNSTPDGTSLVTAPDAVTIIETYGPMVSALARRMIRDPHRAQDAVQEAWLQVLKGLHTFRGEAKISTWIYTIARRAFMRQIRRDRVYTFQELSDYFHGAERPAIEAGELPQDLWVRRQCDQCLTGMLHCLPPTDRLIYILRDMVGLSFSQVAGVVEKDGVTVRKSISRSRKRLRRFLSRECILVNPQSPCRCRMAARVEEVNLPQAWQKLRQTIRQGKVFLAAEGLLPRENFWEKMMP